MRKQSRFQLTPKLRLVVEEVPSAYTAAVGIFVGCGSRHEPRRLHGLTHLCEHLFFKGTSRKTASEISKISEAYGGELNAFTDREHTCFYGSVPLPQMNETLDLLLEILLDPRLDAEDFEKEREVVIQEVQGYEDNPDEVFGDQMLEIPWGSHPLARRVAGHAEGIKKIPHKAALRFIEEDFLSSEWVLSVASSRRADQVKRLVERALESARGHRFGSLIDQRPKHLPVRPPSLPKRHHARSSVQNFNSEQIQVAFSWPAVDIRNVDEVRWTALASLLGGGSSSYLYKELREDRGLVYSTHAQLLSYSDAGLLVGYFAADKSNWEQALRTAGEVCRGLSQRIGSNEIREARLCLEGATYMSFDGIFPRMEALARQELYFRSYQSLEKSLWELRRLKVEPIRKIALGLQRTPCFQVLGPLSSRKLPRIHQIWEGG